MSAVLHTAPTNSATQMDSAGLDAATAQLDSVILKTNQRCFATCEGPVMFNGTSVKWPKIYIYFQRDSDGAWVRNTVATSNATLTSGASSGQGYFVTLNENNNTDISASGAVVDLDDETTNVADKDKTKFLLFSRGAQATGTCAVHFVGLRAVQYLAGSDNLGGAGTKTVTFPTGITLADTTYKVFLQPAGATTGTAWFLTYAPRVTTKNAGSFVITVSGTPASETFDWMIVP